MWGQAVQQTQAVKEGLGRLLPDHRKAFEARYAELEGDLLALDDQFQAISGLAPGRPLLASHPVYQYLARRYGLNLESVLWEPDAMPDDGQWRELQSMLEGHAAGWMLWEGQPLPAAARCAWPGPAAPGHALLLVNLAQKPGGLGKFVLPQTGRA